MKELTNAIQTGGWNLPLTDGQLGQLDQYARLLVEWNEKINLTAITDRQEIAVKHFLDSLSLLHFVPPEQNAVVLDVGSGAGFPGMVLRIARPDLRLTCMDGTQKRIHFLSELAAALGLQEVVCLHARAEEAGRDPALRETFDYVTARAVANLHALVEYCLPFVKPGGKFVAMKGPDGATEADKAAKAIQTLGGEIRGVHTFTLPGTDFSRTLIEVAKTGQTPAIYPRPGGKMKKKPL